MEEKCYTEEELIDPTLYELYNHRDGLTTGQLIKVLTEVLAPSGDDLRILFGRKDTRFSQKVRNLISHKSIYPKYADYNHQSSLLRINENGEKRLLASKYYEKRRNEIENDSQVEFDGAEDLCDSEFILDFNDIDKKYIDCEPLNYSVFDLKRRYDKKNEGINTGCLILDGSFQRDNVWGKKQKCRLIESLLIGIPIPYLYLFEDKNANLIVIDGRQRLSAIFDFLEGKYTLSNMEFLDFLNGKKITDFNDIKENKLEKYKAKLEDSHLHVIKIGYSTLELFKLKIFERVNQNGTKLNNQELRHALHQGSVTKLLQKLSEIIDINLSLTAKKRMKDRYLILRYIALRLFKTGNLKIYDEKNDKAINVDYTEINLFLASAMDAINTFSVNQINEIENDFLESYEKAKKTFGVNAFKLDEHAPINMILFEITLLFVSLAKKANIADKELNNMIDEFRKIGTDNVDEYGNTEFYQNIKFHRDSKENFEKRLKWIDDIIARHLR